MIYLIIYIVSVIIYFFSLRTMLSKDVDLDIDELYKMILILVIGFVPIANMIILIIILFDFFEYNCNIEPVDILKKILFIKDKRDERWR